MRGAVSASVASWVRANQWRLRCHGYDGRPRAAVAPSNAAEREMSKPAT